MYLNVDLLRLTTVEVPENTDLLMCSFKQRKINSDFGVLMSTTVSIT